MIVYDDYGVKRVEAARTREQVEKMAAQLKREYTCESYGNKIPHACGDKDKRREQEVHKEDITAIKGRRSYATGLIRSDSPRLS